MYIFMHIVIYVNLYIDSINYVKFINRKNDLDT